MYDPLQYQEGRNDDGSVRWKPFDRDEADAVLADLDDTGQAHPLGMRRLLGHLLDAAEPEADPEPDPDVDSEDLIAAHGDGPPDDEPPVGDPESVAAGEPGSGATGDNGTPGRRGRANG